MVLIHKFEIRTFCELSEDLHHFPHTFKVAQNSFQHLDFDGSL